MLLLLRERMEGGQPNPGKVMPGFGPRDVEIGAGSMTRANEPCGDHYPEKLEQLEEAETQFRYSISVQNGEIEGFNNAWRQVSEGIPQNFEDYHSVVRDGCVCRHVV